MNFLLSINRKYILIISLVLFIFIFIFFVFKLYFSLDNKIINNNIKVSNVDITEPRFAINSLTQKIYVTAEEGNFVEDGKILLKKNVMFTSNNFSIESDNVTFNREEQTAQSKDKSIFKSKNTTISSEGFNIYDNGNKINFNGNAKLILKWN